MLLVLTACTKEGEESSKENGGNKDKENKEDVQLTFSIWGNDQHAEMYENLLKDFHDENPNIKVKIDLIPFP